jgi:hypothetical protein
VDCGWADDATLVGIAAMVLASLHGDGAGAGARA